MSFYLECDVLGGRKLIEAAVIEGEGAADMRKVQILPQSRFREMKISAN